MSGSPVYRSATGFGVTHAEHQAMKDYEQGNASALDVLSMLSPKRLADRTVSLDFVGVYAGATGNKYLEKLNLGRVFMASLISLLVTDSLRGENPFPPV
jgi:hypothetical protein